MSAVPRDILANWQVVVIDDEPDSLQVASLVLQAYGAVIHTATNGLEGLERIQSVQPRFVICDLSMPEMDGWALIKAIQKDANLREIPVIALTAHAMLGDRERALAAGFYNYLTKPLTAKTFIHDLLVLLVANPQFADELQY